MHTWHIVLQHIHKQIARHLNNWSGTGHRPTQQQRHQFQSKRVCCRRLFFIREHLRYAIVSREATGLCACVGCERQEQRQQWDEQRFICATKKKLGSFWDCRFFHSFRLHSISVGSTQLTHRQDMSAAVRHDNATTRQTYNKEKPSWQLAEDNRDDDTIRTKFTREFCVKTKCTSTAIYIEDFEISQTLRLYIYSESYYIADFR